MTLKDKDLRAHEGAFASECVADNSMHGKMVLTLSDYQRSVRRGFRHEKKDGVELFTIDSFSELGLPHGFSTRIGGVSTGEFESLNMSFTREKNHDNVRENLRRFVAAAGIDVHDCAIIKYEHGTNIEMIGREHRGMGVFRENDLPFCDGLMVSGPGTAAVAMHADCTPVFFADRLGRAAGVCHAGWRGTVGGVIYAVIERFGALGALPEDIVFGIGPCIGACCFEVQEDVASQFEEKFGRETVQRREGRIFADMVAADLVMLEKVGVPPENVTVAGLCTYCEEGLFYSHRRDKGKTGAMASVICLPER